MNLIAKLLMNSLYGKFGMRTDITKVEVFDCSSDEGVLALDDAIETYGEAIHDSIRIDDIFYIVRDSILDFTYNSEEEMYHGANVNIAIASTITAGARVFMSIFKNNPNFNLYYSDTDSAVVDTQLPASIVGGALGQLKLEYVIERAVFLAPKVYGLVTDEGQEVIKVKGMSPSDINIDDLENLLVKDTSKILTQEKWFKNTMEGKISISDVAYTLKVTSNKRKTLYNNGVFHSTRVF